MADAPKNMTPEEFEKSLKKSPEEIKKTQDEIDRGTFMRNWRRGDVK